ncbi:unnamed protein product [Prorocentrum cordatum]|uniref:Uncharacterized protein n=1 Tax=Prorocentrum cordatum TaxID=2364126 RepID=A0ABN9S8C7_9DINO|nr:unnamed protein product [Polarella glacialis]
MHVHIYVPRCCSPPPPPSPPAAKTRRGRGPRAGADRRRVQREGRRRGRGRASEGATSAICSYADRHVTPRRSIGYVDKALLKLRPLLTIRRGTIANCHASRHNLLHIKHRAQFLRTYVRKPQCKHVLGNVHVRRLASENSWS